MAELNSLTLINDANLKAYYRFEETSGTSVADSSGESHTGTASRSNILNNSDGKYGNRGVFVATETDRISFTDHADFKPTGDFEICFWFKAASNPGSSQRIFSSFYLGTEYAGIIISLETTGKPQLISYRNTGTTDGVDYDGILASTSICDDSWHLVNAYWDQTNLGIIIDNGTAATQAWANAPGYNATNYVRIGDVYAGGEAAPLDGSLDDFALFNGRVLTASERTSLYLPASSASFFFAQL